MLNKNRVFVDPFRHPLWSRVRLIESPYTAEEYAVYVDWYRQTGWVRPVSSDPDPPPPPAPRLRRF